MSRLQQLTHNEAGGQRGTIKTLTFAIMHFTVAFAVTYALTGDFIIGGLVATVEPAVNTVAYYFHEKIWLRLAPSKATTSKAEPAESIVC
ncbi:DUF2061 domain-containing protein [Hydrocarboniclastica marina]|uniref:DUF2061 domain-containing protein n=1 Tax=Hydrocarboniclastica marina TaxID=2259620 RepID=A0A4P7XME1_9ALTE|nr:DUF2061 domain-containing protein [Hydrocarboniclastica marina]QCF27247.1 DUF2061 domain-containing protein [Hydrocarboniclastica marina]